MTELTQHDGIYVLTLGDDENRFSPDWLKQVNAHLDEILSAPAPLVTTSRGKFYSNGLDLDWVMANPEQLDDYVAQVQALLARFLVLPVPTLAAVSGHAFGGGAILAMTHDQRIMRTERGYFCFPEVDLKIPFTNGMAALIQAKVTPQVAITAMGSGHRYDAASGLAAALFDQTADESELLAKAIAAVQPLADKDPATLGAIKTTMYAATVAQLHSHGAATAGIGA